MSLRVLVIEDDPLIAAAIRRQLSSTGYLVCGMAYSAKEAIQTLSECDPQIVLLDIHLGEGQEGIDIGHYIRMHRQIPFIFLTAHADRDTLNKAKATVPAGYIVKPFTEKDLFAALEIAYANHLQNPQSGTPIPLKTWENELLDVLSDREIEIVRLIRDGYTNQGIAGQLFISINTVKTHLNHIYQKLNVSSRTGLLAKIRQ